jgi:ribosomal protein S18 acetylase RimI-like enzyme
MPDDWSRLRDVRLAALADSPDAFSATREAAASYADSVWIDRASLAAEGGSQATFVAVGVAGSMLGMVTGLADPDDPYVCRLVSLWIDPLVRRAGYGSALTTALCEWATASGFKNVQLWVTVSNEFARQMYEGVGFAPTGHDRPLPSDPRLSETLYDRAL